MKRFTQYLKEKMRDPEYRKRYDALDPEFAAVEEGMARPEEDQGQSIVHESHYWLITALAVVVTAIVVGGGMWWWMNGDIGDQLILPAIRVSQEKDIEQQNSGDVFYSQALLNMFRDHGGVGTRSASGGEKEFLVARLYGSSFENDGFSYEFRYDPVSGQLAPTGMNVTSSRGKAEVATTDVRDIVVVTSNIGEYATTLTKDYYINYTTNELITVENNNLFYGGRNMEIIITDAQGETATLKHSLAKRCDEVDEEAIIDGLLLDEAVIPFPEQKTYCSKDNYRDLTYLGVALTVTGVSKDLNSVYFSSKGWHITYSYPENKSIWERNDKWSTDYVYDLETKTVQPGEPENLLTVFNESYYNEN